MALSERTVKILAALSVPVRLYLGVVFIEASIYKIQEPYEFALGVATYQILPLGMVNLVALLLPWIEIVTGVFLIVGFWTKENAFLVLGMMVVFLAALVIALARGYEMSCGFFASQEAAENIGIPTLYRDIVWIVLALFALLFDNGRFGVDRFLRRRNRYA